MALKDFKPITQELELLSPKDNNPLGIFIKVVGPDSKEVRTIERELQKDGIARGKAGNEIELEEIEQVLIKKFAAAVVGWDEKYNDDMGGAYSKEFVTQLFEDTDYRWVVDQVAAYVSKRQNFFR
jgi:hypothetical protein